MRWCFLTCIEKLLYILLHTIVEKLLYILLHTIVMHYQQT